MADWGTPHNTYLATRVSTHNQSGGAGPGGGLGGKLFGFYFSRVTNIQDPNTMGRIKVRHHWLEEEGGPELESDWIMQCSPWAGPTNLNRNRVFGIDLPMPEVGSDVVIAFEGGDPHSPIWFGQPRYNSPPYGAPPVQKDSRTDWSFRLNFQNGTEFGVDTEGNCYLNVNGNLRVKVLGSAFISARGCLTMMGVMVRALAQTVLRLCGVPIDETGYQRPEEKAELREMQIDAYVSAPRMEDPGVGQTPDYIDNDQAPTP